ncbi:putative autotransporter [Yersinia enterocolitica]|uniref:Autotransporter n=2 Tax=Enterobacterales TaxID=91347 RepID=A0A9P1V5E8_YEREN|nr:autotransporter outer membrane beta-barrel domain-containing protein [Yersinia enterocolitica]CNG58233.1 putative autotransporter [Yersinia enterocolitica]
MNKVYNTVWNESKGMWVVTSELTRKGGLRPRQIKRTALAGLIAGLLLPSQPVLAAAYDNQTLGKGGTMYLGAGDTATNTTINNGGQQHISSGGSATSTTINAAGAQHVSNGGSATDTTIRYGNQYVSSGGSATNTNISGSISNQTVYIGGSATNTVVSASGKQTVYGSATSTTLSNNGTQNVYSGGSASGTVINTTGYQYVFSGGSATDTTINNGAQFVSSGGSATDTTINSGGRQYVLSGGSATDTTINSGGRQFVSSGGSASGTTINAGTQYVSGGASATDTTINSGGLQYVLSGGSASGTTINAGTQNVSSGASATDTTINSGGLQYVLSGASATDTTINSGGRQYVLRGASATDTTINNGAQYVSSGASATDTTINNGAQYVSSGASATDTTINNGAQYVSSGASATDTTINSGGLQAVISGGRATSTTVHSGGVLQVSAGGSASLVTQNSGGAVVTNTSAALSGTNDKGSFSIVSGNAANMLLENGGYLEVLKDHKASDTTVGSNGTLYVHSGGVLHGTTTLTDKGTLVGDVVTNEGKLYFLNNSDASFTGSLMGAGTLIQEGGSTRFSGLLSQDGGIALQSGGAMTMDALTAKANVTTQSGTTLTLDNGTTLTGNIAGDSTGAGDVAVKGSSVWHLDGDSTVGALTMDNGTVDFRSSTTTRLTPVFQAVSLALGSLSGSGTFRMNTDIASHIGDMLKVAGNASGNFVLDIKNTGREPVSAGAPLQVVQTGGGDAAFTLNGGKVDAGTWEYVLNKVNTDWYLVPDLHPPVPTNPDIGTPDAGTPDAGTSSPVRHTTKSADAVLSMATAPAYVFNSELQNLRFRHGDFMENTRSPGGVWGRYTGSDHRISGGASSGYSLTQNGFEIGGDKVFDLGESRLAVGAFVSYTDNSISHNRGGDSTIGSTGGGLYATWSDNDGYYVDGVLKYNRFSNELRTRMSDGTAVKGDYSQNGFGGSLEAGKTFSLNDNAWAQPYVRTTAFRADAKDISLNNGMEASLGATKSLQAEAGVNLGMNLDVAGKTVKPYLKAAVSHEFSDSNKVRINNLYDFNNDISGTMGKYGAGVSAQLTPNAEVWAEANYQKGGKIESPVTGSVGFRINF